MGIGRERIGGAEEVAAVVESGDAVVDADEGAADATCLHLKPGVEKGALERVVELRMRDVVAVVVRLDGDERTHRVVRRLHKKRGLEERFALTHHIVEERDGGDGAAPDGGGDDGIGDYFGTLAQGLQRTGDGALEQLVETTGLEGGDVVAEGRIEGGIKGGEGEKINLSLRDIRGY